VPHSPSKVSYLPAQQGVSLKKHSLTAAFALLVIGGATACGTTTPQAPATAPPADDKAPCAMTSTVRTIAADALAPVAATLARKPLTAEEIAKATDDLKATFTTMHIGVAAAAEKASDPNLKAKISVYQYAVEQAIVVVEGADGQPDKLAAAIDLPALREAKQDVIEACEAISPAG
jgi:hypothetical protein